MILAAPEKYLAVSVARRARRVGWFMPVLPQQGEAAGFHLWSVRKPGNRPRMESKPTVAAVVVAPRGVETDAKLTNGGSPRELGVPRPNALLDSGAVAATDERGQPSPRDSSDGRKYIQNGFPLLHLSSLVSLGAKVVRASVPTRLLEWFIGSWKPSSRMSPAVIVPKVEGSVSSDLCASTTPGTRGDVLELALCVKAIAAHDSLRSIETVAELIQSIQTNAPQLLSTHRDLLRRLIRDVIAGKGIDSETEAVVGLCQRDQEEVAVAQKANLEFLTTAYRTLESLTEEASWPVMSEPSDHQLVVNDNCRYWDKLSNECLSVDAFNRPSISTLQTRKALEEWLLLQSSLWLLHHRPTRQICRFGSLHSGFGLRTADIDISINVPHIDLSGRKGMVRSQLAHSIGRLAQALKAVEGVGGVPFESVTPIFARTPVVKVVFRNSLSADISVNNVEGICNTALAQMFGSLDPRVRPLTRIIKLWAFHRGINNRMRGTMSSYVIVLMVFFLLQQRSKPLLPRFRDVSSDRLKLVLEACPDLVNEILTGMGTGRGSMNTIAPQSGTSVQQSSSPIEIAMQLLLTCDQGYTQKFVTDPEFVLRYMFPRHGSPGESSQDDPSVGQLLYEFFELYGRDTQWTSRQLIDFRAPSDPTTTTTSTTPMALLHLVVVCPLSNKYVNSYTNDSWKKIANELHRGYEIICRDRGSLADLIGAGGFRNSNPLHESQNYDVVVDTPTMLPLDATKTTDQSAVHIVYSESPLADTVRLAHVLSILTSKQESPIRKKRNFNYHLDKRQPKHSAMAA